MSRGVVEAWGRIENVVRKIDASYGERFTGGAKGRHRVKTLDRTLNYRRYPIDVSPSQFHKG